MTEPTATDSFNRPPRIQFAPVHGVIEIPAPAEDPDESNRNLLLSLLPFTGILIMGGFYLYIGSQSGRSGLFALPMLAMGVVSVLTSLLTYSFQKREQLKRRVRSRRSYHRLLNRRQARLQAARDLQLHYRRVNYPPPAELLDRVLQQDLSLWNRRLEDEDFSTVRLGMGQMPSSVEVRLPDPDQQAQDLIRALEIGFRYRSVEETSVTVNLRNSGSLGIYGARADVLGFVYSLVAQAATFHAPADLELYLFSSPLGYRSWLWTRWLPHTSEDHQGGFPTYIAYNPHAARALVDQLAQRVEARMGPPAGDSPAFDQALIVAIIDDPSSIESEVAYQTLLEQSGPRTGVITLCLADEIRAVSASCSAVVRVEPDRFLAEFKGPDAFRLEGKPDMMTRTEVERLARHLANLHLPQVGDARRIPTTVDYLQMYRAQTLADLQIERRWQRPVLKGVLPFPVRIGNTSYTTPLNFHLAEQEHGPHGLVAGTTGSGKSELLQSIVCALAMEHHPYLINFLLIDYKGGSTFNLFKGLPHTVGLITNLNTDEALRALEAIESENRRRQTFLARHNVADINEYHRELGRFNGQLHPQWEPLPHLCIIIDEFAELKSELPGFLDELVATVRVGRSLGMHLVLATQRPMGHVTDEMQANLQFRICLRVQNPEESREMLRRPDAAYLPHNIPGRAFFQVGTMMEQFQSAYVGMEHAGRDGDEEQHAAPVTNLVYQEQTAAFAASGDSPGEGARAPNGSSAKGSKFAEVLVGSMSRLFHEMQQENPALARPKDVLLPSLSKEIALQTVLHAEAYDFGGWNPRTNWWDYVASDRDRRRWLCAPIGLIDHLAKREQPPLLANLLGSDNLHGPGGNLLVVGGAGSGKTTLLRTLAMSLAHLYSPADAQMYALSFAGHELNLLEGLPHVGAVITGEQRERVLRLLRFLLKTLDDRRLSFAQMGVDNLEMYNHRLSQLRRANAPQNATYQEMDFYPAIIVLIDNVVEFQKSFPDEMDELMQLLRNGRAGGIHFAVTSSAPNISPQMTNLLEQRIALHLVERTDYNGIVGRLDGREPSSSPGSGILRQSPPLHVQIALPGQGNTDEERNEHMQRVIQAMSEAWGARARPAEIQVLPKNLALDTPQGLLRQMPVRTPSGPKAGFERILTPLGRESLTLKTKTLDWLQEGPHFLISGPVASGKSSLLRSLLLGAAYRYSPGELWMLLVDFSQRSLRPLAQLPHVTGYAASEDDLFEQLAHFQAELDRRRGQVERLRQTYDESQLDGDETYRFPPVVLAFDDYDQIPEAMERFPLMLDEIGRGIRRNTDLGYHLLLAGESSSLSRLVTRDILLRQVCLMRCGFSLMTADAVDLLGGRATAALRREDHPEGRGYWVLRGRPSLIQFAQSLELPDLIQGIKCQWQDEPRAAWPCPVPPEQIATMRAGAIVAPVVSTRETVSLGGMLDDFLSPELIEDYRNQKRSQ